MTARLTQSGCNCSVSVINMGREVAHSGHGSKGSSVYGRASSSCSVSGRASNGSSVYSIVINGSLVNTHVQQ